MKLFRRKPRPIPPEAVDARAHALDEQGKAIEQLSIARSMATALAAMRERNHFAESMQIAYRKAQHD